MILTSSVHGSASITLLGQTVLNVKRNTDDRDHRLQEVYRAYFKGLYIVFVSTVMQVFLTSGQRISRATRAAGCWIPGSSFFACSAMVVKKYKFPSPVA